MGSIRLHVQISRQFCHIDNYRKEDYSFTIEWGKIFLFYQENPDTSNEVVGMSKTVEASALQKDDYVIIKGVPCKIIQLLASKPGKCGRPKVI